MHSHKSNAFSEKINTIQTTFLSALDDFKQYYVFYNTHPEVDEYQNYYANSKSQLQSLNKDILTTTNNIDEQINVLANDISSLQLKLQDEKGLYEQLTNRHAKLQNTQTGAEILIDDSKTQYNIQYYYNWEIIIGVIILSIMLSKAKSSP